MYRITLIFALLLTNPVFSQQKSTQYTISGLLTNLKGRTVYLMPVSQFSADPLNPNQPIIDSSISADGRFTFQGSIGEANYYALGIKGNQQKQFKSFILDNTPVSIIGDADSLEQASIVGSMAIREAKILQLMLEPVQKRIDAVSMLRGNAIQKGDSAADRKYGHEYAALIRERVDLKCVFIESYPNSLVSLFALQEISHHLPKERVKALWNTLYYSLHDHSAGQKIRELAFDRKPEPRQPIPNLILSDKLNKPVSLLSYTGKVVLIDFWASWCDHCREEHARLKSIYSQYKDKGLQIISISVDEDPQAWKKALQKAGLPWTQLSDRVGSKNVVGTHYGNSTLPINLLVDQEGYVIRKGLHGAELEKQLAVVFNNP